MEHFDLLEATRKYFQYRPDEAYTFEEVYSQFQRWQAKAYRCKRGELCWSAGTPAKEFAVVISGVIHVKLACESGDDIIVRTVSPGVFFGLSHLFSANRDGIHHYDIVAAQPAEFITYSIEEVLKWRGDPKSLPLFEFLGTQLSRDCVEAYNKAAILSGNDITERLRRYLAMRIKQEGKRKVSFPGTSAELAEYLGVNKCAMSRVIGKLRAAGILDFHHGVFTVK